MLCFDCWLNLWFVCWLNVCLLPAWSRWNFSWLFLWKFLCFAFFVAFYLFVTMLASIGNSCELILVKLCASCSEIDVFYWITPKLLLYTTSFVSNGSHAVVVWVSYYVSFNVWIFECMNVWNTITIVLFCKNFY